MPLPNPPALQQLRRLDRSSSDFPDQLSNVLYGEEYQKSVPNLQGDDLAWLVHYLDKVCHHVTLPHTPLNVERARSTRSTASTGPIVTVRITLISDPDTWIDGALMAASIMSRVPLRHQARPNMVCAHYVVCINMMAPPLCNTSLLSSLPPSPLLIKPPSPLTPGKT